MYERFEKLLLDNNMKASEVAKSTGIAPSTLSDWKNGRSNPKLDKIKRISDFFGVSYLWLLGEAPYYDNDISRNNSIKIPLFRDVSIDLIPDKYDVIGWESISVNTESSKDYFALKAKDDSMSPMINEEDTLIIKKQSTIDSGKIAIIHVNNIGVICKKVIKYKDGINLVSINHKYDPIYFDNSCIINKKLVIIGKVVELRRKL